jgi:hypothetical protein
MIVHEKIIFQTDVLSPIGGVLGRVMHNMSVFHVIFSPSCKLRLIWQMDHKMKMKKVHNILGLKY